MIRLIFFLVFSISYLNLVFAQTGSYSSDLPKTGLTAYFSVKPVYRGIMVGAEIIDMKNEKSILTGNYIYKWTIRGSEEEITKQSNSNVVFFLLNSRNNTFSLVLDIYPLIGSDRPLYTFSQSIVLSEPQVKIVKKSKSLLFPFDGQLNSDELLTFNFDNFVSLPDRTLWYFNEVFFANKKEISINDLKAKKGIIKLQVFSKRNERAVDIKSIQIQP